MCFRFVVNSENNRSKNPEISMFYFSVGSSYGAERAKLWRIFEWGIMIYNMKKHEVGYSGP
jgi:hypothetical protein